MHGLARTAALLLIAAIPLAAAAQAGIPRSSPTAARGGAAAAAQPDAAALSGRYVGKVQGERAVLELTQESGALAGRLAVGAHRYDLEGVVAQGIGRGRMVYQGDGTRFQFAVTRAGAAVTLHTRMFVLGVPVDVPPMVFRRAGSAGAQAADLAATPGEVGQARGRDAGLAAEEGERDRRLVGSWAHSSSYTSGDFSAATRTEIHLLPDGRVVEGGSRVVGGGASGSFDSGGGGRGRVTAHWRTQDRILYLRDASGGPWNALARYGLTDDGSTAMLTYGNGSKKLWHRQ
jgi:hypothetical protein